MKALVIRGPGTMGLSSVTVEDSGDGDILTFLHDRVGGHFDVVQLWDGASHPSASMYVHDEGLLRGYPRNVIATQVAYGTQEAHTLPQSPLLEGALVISLYDGPLYIAGDAVVLGFDPETGNSTDISTQWIAKVLAAQLRVDLGEVS